MFTLFPETQAQIALELFGKELSHHNQLEPSKTPDNSDSDDDSSDMIKRKNRIKIILKAYRYYCRKYAGFGFLSSFIPGREAFLVRTILAQEVKQFSKALALSLHSPSDISQTVARFEHWVNTYLLHSTSGMIFGLFLRSTVQPLLILCTLIPSTWEISPVPTIKKLFLELILGDIYFVDSKNAVHLKKDKVANLFHTLCNPVRLVNHFIFFLLSVAVHAIKMGSKKDSVPGPIQAILKYIVAALFPILSIPLKAAETIADIPYQLLKHTLYTPLQFIGSTIKQAFKRKTYLLLKAADVQDLLLLQKTTQPVILNRRSLKLHLPPYSFIRISTRETAKIQQALDIASSNDLEEKKIRRLKTLASISPNQSSLSTPLTLQKKQPSFDFTKLISKVGFYSANHPPKNITKNTSHEYRQKVTF